ncbi:MAG TPA: penicillin-binding protein 2, partial [Pseudolysinimonas sp.]|nr:penicillin-binding protein 2 [Pseudolysinimonas sp.]
MTHSRLTARRLTMTLVAVLAIVGIFVVKLVDIQVVRAAELTAAAEARRSSTVTVHGVRGSIVDANGVALADSVERYDITAAPVNVGVETSITLDGERVKVPTTEAIAKLADVTGAPAADLYAALTVDPESQFTYLVKAVDLDTLMAVWQLDIAWIYS